MVAKLFIMLVVVVVGFVPMALAQPVIQLTAATTRLSPIDTATSYGMMLGHKWRGGLAIHTGLSLMQAMHSGSDILLIGFPAATVIQAFTLTGPFAWHLGGGFTMHHALGNVNHHFISNHAIIGVSIAIRPRVATMLQWVSNQGSHQQISFKGQSVMLGLEGALFAPPPKRVKPHMPPQQRFQPRQRRQPRAQPSPYQQTQKLMNELSWPSY
jgi:hypothetical protein